MTIEAYPLTWPVGWKRTLPHQRQTSRYKVQFTRARDEVIREVRLMPNAHRESIVISSNIPVRRDGLPYADMREPADPGIALYWDERKWNQAASRYDVEPRVIACDAWRTVRENLRALGLAIEALRMLERTGASEILDRAFTGFAALPPASTQPAAWWITLGFDWPPASADIVEAAYRERARRAHPDAGGSHEEMVKLNAAIVLARNHFRSVPL